MKRFLFPLFLAAVVLVSCEKSVADDADVSQAAADISLSGTWKMILVKDNSTNASVTKPSNIEKDVLISFTPSNSLTGTFTGKTPTNSIDQNPYSISANLLISIPVLSMTKVAETAWGAEFVDNIRSAKYYGFEAGEKLCIWTTNKKLVFQKQ